ncbi:hypothetical protein [Allonocardiopsis opalescens]|uniref:Uncharacterized protein n=1 Tax=Allonocardiopsis opalescens TaxID=1144618 RepID=A0A2T0PUH6_9ACTN|nr:hypothetical protein [Allonocardiopsis opalescens]PRX92458.1 hypothetical protein CLV72_110219 [Allonocardiopsis opalescens]
MNGIEGTNGTTRADTSGAPPGGSAPRSGRFWPDWGRIGRAAAVGALSTLGVAAVGLGAATLIDSSPLAADVVGANIGLGIGLLAFRLVATPVVGWLALRWTGVRERAGWTALIALAVYLGLSALLPDIQPPLDWPAMALFGAIAGAVAGYATQGGPRRAPRG